MAEKTSKSVETFAENVNKKDKSNGRKVRFAFVKRKRQHT